MFRSELDLDKDQIHWLFSSVRGAWVRSGHRHAGVKGAEKNFMDLSKFRPDPAPSTP